MIKGKSKIELYNANTRIKEVYENENLVTNALTWILGQNIAGFANTTFMNEYLPLYKKGLGGVMLFDNTITESANTVVAPSTIGCTGYASNTAYSGTDTKRGGMNLNETEETATGMKLVWDFATSQANGTIQCLALTSARGGEVGYGSSVLNAVSDGKFMYNYNYNATWESEINSSIEWVETIDYIYRILRTSSTVITIEKYKNFKSKVSLTNYYAEKDLVDTYTLSVTTNSNNYGLTASIVGSYIYISTLMSVNEIKLIKVSLSDFSKTEQSFTGTSLFNTSYIRALHAIRGSYIYFRGNGVLQKFNLSTAAFIVTITCPNNFVCNVNDYIITGARMLDASDNIRYISTTDYNYSPLATRSYYDTPCDIYKGLFWVGWTYSSSSETRSFSVISNYLATINNLSSAVTKDASKTMKITYTLTES